MYLRNIKGGNFGKNLANDAQFTKYFPHQCHGLTVISCNCNYAY